MGRGERSHRFDGIFGRGRIDHGVLLDHDADSRPDFAAPVYGYMDDVAPPKDAPPVFIVATQADNLVPSGRSVMITNAGALRIYPRSCHLFEQGPPWIRHAPKRDCRLISGKVCSSSGCARVV